VNAPFSKPWWNALHCACILGSVSAHEACAEQRFLLAADNQVIEVDRQISIQASVTSDAQ
jgi:hypothetical protein